MKKIIFSIATFSLISTLFAQEKEISTAYSAFEKNDRQTARTELSKATNLIDKTTDPKSLANYYYVNGELLLADGNIEEAAKSFEQMAKYEIGPIYSVRNKANKTTEYYFTLAEAENIASKGDYTKPKEEKLSAQNMSKVVDKLKGLAERSIQQANAAFQSQNHNEAGQKFLEASYLVDAIGLEGDIFRYNAAISFHQAGNHDKAFVVYKQLIDDGYDGVSTTYLGIDNEGNEIPYGTKEEAENSKKIGIIKSYKQVKTPSIEIDLYSNALKALSALNRFDEIVNLIDTKYPQEGEIQTLIGNVYHNSGNIEQFKEKLLDNIKINPNDPVNYFNLGVIYMDKSDDAQAIKYFTQATEKAPNSITAKNAFNNIALIKIKPESEYIEIINSNLGPNEKERKIYLEYTKKRKDLYADAVPYLEKAYQIDKNDLQAVSTLRKAYQAAEMFDKEDEMREIERRLQGK